MDEPDEDSSQRAPSPFTRAFNDHLSSEVMGTNSNRLHIFLDRPSAPYAHILAYLRTPSDALASLPRAVQFGAAPLSSSITITKLDAIFELRDEAVYLGLDELVQLCDNELKSWYGMKRDSAQPPLPSSHRRGRSGGSPGLRPTRTSLNTPLTSASNVTIKPLAAINTSAKHAQRSEGSDEEDHLVSIMPAMDSPAAIASHESGHGGRSRSSSRNRSDVPPPRPPNPYTSGVAPTMRHNRGGTTGTGSSTSNWI
ncbi:hypothetical protein FRC02_005506 [Tulasnella sp. 418]|nr:hypothetical protein FRC02_005506 [Tulasnella sp. 418]